MAAGRRQRRVACNELIDRRDTPCVANAGSPAALRDLVFVAVMERLLLFGRIVPGGFRMPRFFFDITEDDKTVTDPDGHELPSTQKAHEEAVRTTSELSMDTATTTRAHDVKVAVYDASKHLICTTKVSFDLDEIER